MTSSWVAPGSVAYTSLRFGQCHSRYWFIISIRLSNYGNYSCSWNSRFCWENPFAASEVYVIRPCHSLSDVRIMSVSFRFGASPDSKAHGANMGPIWVLSALDGPYVGPMNLAILGPYTVYPQACTQFIVLHRVFDCIIVWLDIQNTTKRESLVYLLWWIQTFPR